MNNNEIQFDILKDKLKKYKRISYSLCLILLFFIINISFFSYNESDISFNNVSTKSNVKNYLGYFGSYFADLLIQLFGFVSIIFSIIFFIIGVKKIFNRRRLYSSSKKIIAFMGLFISSSILCSFIQNDKYCDDGCGGLFSNILVNNLYYLPSYFVFLLSYFIFFISISYVLDINPKKWIILSAKFYRISKKILNFIFKKIVSKIFIFIIRQNNLQKIKNYFINIFNKTSTEYIMVDVEEKNEDSEEREIKKYKPSSVKKDIFTNTFVHQEKVYILPKTEILNKGTKKNILTTQNDLKNISSKLLEALKEYKIDGEIIDIKVGPIVTLFEFLPSAGIKSSRIIGLTDDIARKMKALSVRIYIMPGKEGIAIELSNQVRETIYIKDMLESKEFKENNYSLPIVIGTDISGTVVIKDLAKMPHLLVAGTTGSGKSVAVNTMIISLLYKFAPDECKLILVDPKIVEFSKYDGIPHLLAPVVTESQRAISVLMWLCSEMNKRYEIMASLAVKDINEYNKKVARFENENKNKTLFGKFKVGFDAQTGEILYEEREMKLTKMPFIVVAIDEMADLMLTAGKEINSYIQSLAQKARAAGIHIIMATQRPSVDVITGVIKSNFPNRMSFKVSSSVDSMTIITQKGAEQLLGNGDMLLLSDGSKTKRHHGPYISDEEVERVTNFIKKQGFKPEFEPEILKMNGNANKNGNDYNNNLSSENELSSDDKNDLYNQALEIIRTDKKCSISYLQRKLHIGYNKSASILEQLENDGYLSKQDMKGNRKILFDNDDE